MYQTIPYSKKTKQSESIEGKDMVKNHAGGYSFKVDHWTLFQRFLIMGSEGGCYYVGADRLTRDACKSIVKCLSEDINRTFNMILSVSESGRAPSNEPALFALAICASIMPSWFNNLDQYKFNESNLLAIRVKAFFHLDRVARTGTHLFHFVQYMDSMRGWGASAKYGLQQWYLKKSDKDLVHQVTKYKQRDGWSHRDIFRKVRPKSHRAEFNYIAKYVVDPQDDLPHYKPGDSYELMRLKLIHDIQKGMVNQEDICKYLNSETFSLPREIIPTDMLNSVSIWEGLLKQMPMMAMVRNLPKMTTIRLLKPLSFHENTVISRLANPEMIQRSKIHPFQILTALNTYKRGKGVKGSLTWEPNQRIVNALNDAFYLAFDNVTPTNKNIMIALDVSGSMGYECLKGSALNCREASAALSMVTLRVEKNVIIKGFTGQHYPRKKAELTDIPITDRLPEMVDFIHKLNFGPTDCALPMVWALENQIPLDAFVIYTDSETWVGDIHPCQALEEYNRKMNRQAKLIVVGMVANDISIADPKNPLMIDIAGFDSSTPQFITEFINS